MNILAIETSFDETAVAIVKDGTTVLSSVLASSHAVHEKYGGVVPEIAARKQVECIVPVLTEALKLGSVNSGSDLESLEGPASFVTDIDAIAVTVGPGLIGSLLVGVETAKTLAWVWNKPIIPVNHVLAHMYANFVSSQFTDHGSQNIGLSSQLKNTQNNLLRTMNYELINFPAISLVVSGAHTELYLMESPKKLTWLGGTLDDAAGECFDKCARLLGFGNRGGLAIQEAASKFKVGSSQFAVKLPRPMMYDKSLNFSFSGLKTAVSREWNTSTSLSVKKSPKDPQLTTYNLQLANLFAFEIQEAITDVLVAKTLSAAQKYNAKSILLSGGVAANLRLREKFAVRSSQFIVATPPVSLCTDNAVYIASYAYFRGAAVNWEKIEAQPDLSVEIIN